MIFGVCFRTPRPAHRLATLFWLLLAFETAQSNAAAQDGAGDNVRHVHGTVVDSSTGKGIARALVESNDQRLATMTDNDGHFTLDVRLTQAPGGPAASFSSVSVGNARAYNGAFDLTAQRPGYIFSDLPAILSLNTAASADLVLRLTPQAVIAGRVSASETESPANVRVSLLERQVVEGERVWANAGGVSTDSRGEFRFSHLQPGEYTLFTGEWRDDHFLPPGDSGITREYPPAFLGDAAGLPSAGTLVVHPGETASAELHIHPASYFPVTVPVSVEGAPYINVTVESAGTRRAFELGYDLREHAVTGSLPGGSYTLLISRLSPPLASATVPLTVTDRAVHAAPVTLLPLTPIPVRVNMDLTNANPGNGAPASPFVQLNLVPVEFGAGNPVSGIRQPNAGNDFLVEGVQPGRYRVEAEASPGYVAAVSAAGTDLLQEPLIVGSGAVSPIDLTVRDDSATLTLSVSNGDAPVPERCFVMLVPTAGTSQVTEIPPATDTPRTLPSLAPGRYRLFAFRYPNFALPYRDPEAMHRYDGQGISITLAAGQAQTVTVPLLDPALEEQR